MSDLLIRLTADDAGQDLIEYSLLAALIAVVCIGAMTALGQEILNIVDDIAAAVDGAFGG